MDSRRNACVTVKVDPNELEQLLITDADGSRVSIALIRLCDSVCLSVRTIKTKTAETKIAKLGTG